MVNPTPDKSGSASTGPQQTQYKKWKYIEDDKTMCKCKVESQKTSSAAAVIHPVVYNDTAKDCVENWIGLL